MIYTIEKCPYCGKIQIRFLKKKENLTIKWHECINCKKKYRLYTKKEQRVLEISDDVFYIMEKYRQLEGKDTREPTYKVVTVECPHCNTKSEKLLHVSTLDKNYILIKCPNCNKKFYAKTKNKSRIAFL